MKLTWLQLQDVMKPDSVAGHYVSFYQGKHYTIAELIDGVVYLTPDGEMWAEKLGTQEAEVVPPAARKVVRQLS